MQQSPKDLVDTLRGRRTVHQFRADPVPPALVETAIEHARWAPNHYLTEPWRFVLLGPDTISGVLTVAREVLTERQGERPAATKVERWSAIPGWLFVSYLRDADDPLRDQENYAAACCAVQNLQLSLWASGVGVKWTTGPVTRDARLFELLDIDPEREAAVGMFWYGWPAEVGEQKRRPVADILRRLP